MGRSPRTFALLSGGEIVSSGILERLLRARCQALSGKSASARIYYCRLAPALLAHRGNGKKNKTDELNALRLMTLQSCIISMACLGSSAEKREMLVKKGKPGDRSPPVPLAVTAEGLPRLLLSSLEPLESR